MTQHFNTTSSMGRLTLNVLLLFAQEREVSGERIRDKIAASKKKGMRMGGPVALGYRVADTKLVVDALNLAFLSPDLVTAAVGGTLPNTTGISRLMKGPMEWEGQRDSV